MSRKLLLLLASTLGARGAGFTADSARGARLFEKFACIQCHSVNGTGGKLAPDLGRIVDRGFTPASLAATMWNHGPTMWGAIEEHQIPLGALDQQSAQDLMAFFYAARYFEQRGDAGRGKRSFESLGCSGCHGLTAVVNPKAKPVSEWPALTEPLALLEAMWNHRAEMQAESQARGGKLPQLTEQSLTDMLVYLRNLPDTRSKAGAFQLEVVSANLAVFDSAGCAKCHQTVEALSGKVQGKTLTEVAADMWNHAPRMLAAGASTAPLGPGEMRAIVSAVWADKFFEDAGRPKAGAGVFASKNCGVCHQNASGGAPQLPAAGREFGGAAMVSALWLHGPGMLAQMKTKGVAWPRFEGTQMTDLIAYLNTGHPVHP